MNISALCKILVRFSPVTHEFTLLTITPFLWQYGKNRHITPNISEYRGLVLTYFIRLVDALVRMIIPIFDWRSPRGRWYDTAKKLAYKLVEYLWIYWTDFRKLFTI